MAHLIASEHLPIHLASGQHAHAGNNNLKKLDSIFYLRQFKDLRLINLAGNPFCKEHDYRWEHLRQAMRQGMGK